MVCQAAVVAWKTRLAVSMEDQIGSYGDESEFTAEELAKLDGEGRCVITEHQIRLVPSLTACSTRLVV